MSVLCVYIYIYVYISVYSTFFFHQRPGILQISIVDGETCVCSWYRYFGDAVSCLCNGHCWPIMGPTWAQEWAIMGPNMWHLFMSFLNNGQVSRSTPVLCICFFFNIYIYIYMWHLFVCLTMAKYHDQCQQINNSRINTQIKCGATAFMHYGLCSTSPQKHVYITLRIHGHV
jgi:hypothetical protein